MISLRRPACLLALAGAIALSGAEVSAQPMLPFAVQNQLEFSNYLITDREDLFPNYLSPAGNQPGDALFKVIPAWVLERDEDHVLSGYQVGVSIDDTYTGPFPVSALLPEVRIHRTTTATLHGEAYDVPDLSREVVTFDPVQLQLDSDGAWVVEYRLLTFEIPIPGFPPEVLAIPARENGQRQGLAIMAMAEVGARRDPGVPGVVLQSSFGERHFAPGRSSYSGSYDAVNGFRMFGSTGMPSATGELYMMLRFTNPVLQIAGSQAGGLVGEPSETQMGPGAYATDIATAPTPPRPDFGVFVQAEQHDPGAGSATHLAIPLVVALSPTGPTLSLPIGNVALRVAPTELGALDLLIQAGLSGPLTTLAPGSGAGFALPRPGAYASPRVPLRRQRSWRGSAFWVQAVILDNTFTPVDVTNAVRWTFD